MSLSHVNLSLFNGFLLLGYILVVSESGSIHHFLMVSIVRLHPGYPSTFNGFVIESPAVHHIFMGSVIESGVIHQVLMGFSSDSVSDSAYLYIGGAVRQKFLQSDIHS